VVTYTPDISDPTPSASLWFNDSLAPLGSPGEAAGAGQGRFIALSASLSQYPTFTQYLVPEVTTSTSPGQIVLGGDVADQVTLQGNSGGGAPTGTVNYYVCQMPSNMTSGSCPATTTPLEAAPLFPGAGDMSSSHSIEFTPPSSPSSVGTWCFSTSYGGDSYYDVVSDNTGTGNLDDGECFSVVSSGATPEGSTTVSLSLSQASVVSGSESAEAFTVTVMNPSADGLSEGWVSVWDGSALLCDTFALGDDGGDAVQGICSLSSAELAPGTYGDLFGDYVATSSSSAFGGDTSDFPQSLDVVSVTTTPPTTTPPTTTPPTSAPSSPGSLPMSGYDMVGSDGGVFVFPEGQSGGFYGSLPGLGVHVDDIAGMVPSSDDKGYFLVGQDGGVFSFGDAPFLGSLPGLHVSVHDIKGIVPTADNHGYFLVGSDGGVFTFGDAPFLGSLPGRGIHVDDVIGIAATPSDQGYWVVEADGTVYAFGSATAWGSALGTNSPVAGITSTSDGGGYWIVTQNGGVYPFGDAGNYGSLPKLGVTPARPVIGLVPTADDQGYWLIGSDGGIFAFGDAPFVGSLPGLGVHITDIVGAVPTTP
jgi:hypothetical protein